MATRANSKKAGLKRALWPECRGTMAALIRTGQWRVGPLGAIESWPRALKTAVEIMLHGHQPAYVCWGRALTTLYNDAAISVLGSRHPHALGRPCAEVFPEAWDDLKPVIDAALAGEAQNVVGQRLNHGHHQPSWYTYTWMPLRDDAGKIAGLYCVATETSLTIGDEQLRTILENARDAVSMLDLETNKYVFISPSHTPLTGFTADELKTFTPAEYLERLHPDDRHVASHPATSENRDAAAVPVEFRWKVKSGEYRWFSVSRKLVRDESGRPVALVNINRDITERKKAEQEIHASRATLEAALHSMTDAVYITDAEARFVQVNDSFVTFHRYTSKQACADNFADFAEMFDAYFPDGRHAPPLDRPVPRALRGESGISTEYTLVRRDTGERWVGSYSFGPIRDPLGHITGAVVTARDITEAKKAAEALRDSEARLNLAIESAEMGTWEWNLKTNQVVWNTKLYQLLDLTPHDHTVVGQFFDRVHPDDLPDMRRSLDAVVANGRDWRREFRIVRGDGSVGWLVSVGRVFRDADGSPRAMLGVSYDISDQKKSEAELKQSENRYRLLHETQRDGFVLVAMDGHILDCNAIYCEMLGYTREEIGKLTYMNLTPERWQAIEKLIVEHEIIPRGYSDVYEKEYRRKDGSVVPVELRTILARDEDGKPASMWALVRDLSERKANEARTQSLKDQLMHVGRVSELGQVSAGIAHELNQPLAAMLNYSAAAQRLIAKDCRASIEAAATAIAKAGEQAARAGEIIRRMRDFVEKRDTHRMPDDVNAIVREAADLGLIGAKANGIEITFALANDLPQVIADRVQIEQVIVNLLHNAADAMTNSATRRLTLSTRRTDRAIEIAVADTGCGIPDSLQPRLFQPFVTTKATGMGIGLAISRSIVEAHGGEITADSGPTGTVFRFTLPAIP